MTCKVDFEAETLIELVAKIKHFLGHVAFVPPIAPQEPVQEVSEAPAPVTASKPERRPRPRTGPLPVPPEEPAPEPVEEETVDAKAKEAIDLLKLKNEQLDRLRDLFNAGKGTFVRELLQKYGNGAKVFPEVDARHFPAIKADIDRELH